MSGITASVAVASLLVIGAVAPAVAEPAPVPEPSSAATAADPAPTWTESPTDPAAELGAVPGATDPAATESPAPDGGTEAPAEPPQDGTTGESSGDTGADAPEEAEVQGPPMPAAADDEAQAEGEGPGVTPFLVPPATGNNAVISVKTGSDRTSLVGVGPLEGVTLQLYDGAAAPTTPVADAWATCVSDADGDCSFIVPNTQANGANFDRRFWVVQTGAPTNWYTNPDLGTGSSGSTVTPYEFRTGTQLRNGTTYTSQGAFMLTTGNTNNTASGGIWQSSRVNPTFPAQCGIDVALVLDLSGSVAPDLPALKAVASTFVDSLTGTPSNVGLFTFSSLAPAANNPNLALTPVSTAASAQLIKDRIDSYTAVGGTNWDRGIYQVATDSTDYDVAVVITDGNPTFYGNQEGPGNFTRLREVENGVFSANAVKDQGTHMVAFGVGAGIGSAGSGLNLRAISGTASGTDYFQTPDYEEAGNQLRALALGNCEGSVSVIKQVVPSTAPVGSIAGAEPSGGWELTAESQTGGVTVDAPATATTAVGTGAANFGLTFAGGTTSGTVGVLETQQPGFTLQQVDGANAVCTNILTGDPVTVTNDGANGFDVPVTATAAVTCTIYNRAPSPVASLVVNKTWVVNGTSYADGQQPGALTAVAQVAGTPQAWGVPRTGLQQGQSIAVAETTTNGLQGCTFDSQRVTNVNGTTVDQALPSSVTLVAGANSAMVTNTVTCESTLTLAKTVQGGPASPTAWTLDAVAPGSALAGPNGVTGSPGATALVTPGVVYPLAESGGDPNYAQVRGPNAVIIPGSTGTWLCVELDADGSVIPGFSDGLNGGVTVPLGRWIRCTAVNQASTIDVRKIVENRFGGSAVPSDWKLNVTPVSGVPDGVVVPAQSVEGADVATPITVRPGVTYTVSESSTLTGYEQESAQCVSASGAPLGLTFSLLALDTASCTFVNADLPGRLTLVKEVVNDDGGSAEPTDWTLEADGPTPLSGTSGDPAVTGVEVLAGQYTLSETDGPEGYEASDWTCEIPAVEGGEPTPVPVEGGSVSVGVGQTVVCTVVNDDAALSPFTVVKSSDPGSGATVLPGDVITYTVTATRPGEGFGRQVVVTDDLSQVLNNATLVEGSIEASTGGAVLTGTDLVWTIGDLAGTETITYQVRVDDGAYGVTLTNVVTAPGAEPCVEPEPEPEVAPSASALVTDATTLAADATTAAVAAAPTALAVVDPEVACRTTSHVTPAWTLAKTSDPVTGTTVEAGSVITYTLTVTSTTDALVSGAVVTDDLSKVLAYGTLVSPPPGATLSGTTLTWAVPDLATAGATAAISYQVKLSSSAHGVTVTNVATPGPGGGCVSCTTTHKVPPVSATPPSSLPVTGADVAAILTGALLLVLLGGTLVTVRRRRANS